MASRPARDVEKRYTRRAFVSGLRRLADALERGERFSIRVAGERVVVPRDAAFEEIEFQMRWKTARRRKASP